MHYLEVHNKTGLSILVDFVKAFGFIEWELLIRPSTCNWFPSFYFKPKGCVINNGNMSHVFSLGRSCRQRDPLSPYRFIIGVEFLAMKIKANPNIKGKVVNEFES